MRRNVLAASAVAAAVIPLSMGGAHAAPKKTVKAPTAAGDAKALLAKTKALPKSSRRGNLVVLATLAKQQQAHQTCKAIKTLKIYRGSLSKLSKAQRKKTYKLDTAALALQQRLLLRKSAGKCGGGATPATVGEATPTLGRSDTTGVDLTVKLPEVALTSVERGGKTYTQVGANGAQAAQAPGEPAIPTVSYSVAVPEGASVVTTATAGDSYTVPGVDVLPAQPDVVDQDPAARPDFSKAPYADKPFVKPGAAYKGGVFPANAADSSVDGAAHGITIATIQVPLAQYDPKKDALIVHHTVNVKIDFKGGTGAFGGEGGPWDKFGLALADGFVNRSALLEKLGRIQYFPRNCGEEFLIVTSATTRASADALAASRNAAGIRTRVVQTGSGAGEIGTTNAQIQDYIRNEGKRILCVHPGYLLLLGNDELVPTFEISGATSDLPYALSNDADSLPDLASGRIPGQNATEVADAINKIIGYETTPFPSSAATKAFVAAMFQDDNGDGQEERTFAQFGETVSKGLEHRGNTVKRIYTAPGTNPVKWNDGTAIPANLQKPTFPWNGNGTDVSTAWNAGVFLAIHRDHGYSQGWGDPSFSSTNVNALTNTALPVLLSVNCSSGAYDRDNNSFATRALVKPTGGAVAAFGDTEDSPSWHNTQLAYGFVDALLPSILPSEGPASKQRLGDALVWGKVRLNGLAPSPGDGNTLFEHRIWHLYGDPTMNMKGGGSIFRFDFSHLVLKYERLEPIPDPAGPVETPGYQVLVGGLPAELAGKTIALRKGDEVVGQGLVLGDGSVKIPAVFGDGSVKPGELTVVADNTSDTEGPSTFSVPVPEATTPPTTPPATTPTTPVEPAATTLTQVCPTYEKWTTPLTVSGTLQSVPGGTTVTSTFKRIYGPNDPAPSTPQADLVATTKTASDGSFTATTDEAPGQVGNGQWSVTTVYAGDATHKGSTSTTCTFTANRSGTAPGIVG
jgi:hypothetical protein